MKLNRFVSLLVLFTLISFLASSSSLAASKVSGDNPFFTYLPIVSRPFPEPIVPDTTVVLPESTTQYLTSVSPDGAVFTFSQNTPELTRLDPGDVMVGDTSDAAPQGFLRQVTSISSSGDQVVVDTASATLEDAIEQGAISFSKQLTPEDIESMTAQPGVSLFQRTAPTIGDSFFFEIKDVVLYDKDHDPNTTFDQIKANGSFELAPGFTLTLIYRNGELQTLNFVNSVEETAELEFEIEVEVLSLEVIYEIARLHLGVVTVFVGPVPVVFVIEMPIYLRGDGEVTVGISTSVTQQATLTAGLSYDQGAWSPIASLTNDFSWQPPTPSAGAKFKGYFDPPLSLLLYGVAGPFAAADPFLELKADIFADPWWELRAGIEATVGVKVQVLGKTLADHTEVVISTGIVLDHAPPAKTATPTSTNTPTPTPTATPTMTADTPNPTPTSSNTPTPNPTSTQTPGLGTTILVSVASDGTQGDNDSSAATISADGRFVAFESNAGNLVPGDTFDSFDIFIHDRQTGETSLVSVASDGTKGNDGSFAPAISADGRFVTFYSSASNLVPSDTNSSYDIFVHDRLTGQTSRVSVASDGMQGNDISYRPDISADGRYVTFESHANNLVSNDTNGQGDVFVHDRQTGTTRRVSVSTDGAQANSWSQEPVISANGRYVAFGSAASNLVSGDSNGEADVFVHDQQTGETSLVSVATSGAQGNGWSERPSISADGSYVAFYSEASNLVPNDTNGWGDIFVRDRQTSQTLRVSVATDGTQGYGWQEKHAISGDGRYIAFESDANNLVSGDTNGQGDVFVHDLQTGTTSLASVASDGTQGNSVSENPAISADGRYVAFESDASNLVSGDSNNNGDIFLRDRGQ